MTSKNLAAAALGLVLLCVGCSSGPRRAYLSHPGRTVAVLPPYHLDREAIDATWPRLEQALAQKEFQVLPRATVQAFYDEHRFTLPEEIEQYTCQEVAEALGADLVLYTRIEEWEEITTFLVNEIRVTLAALLRDAQGAEVWQGRATRKRSANALNVRKSVSVIASGPAELAPAAASATFAKLPYCQPQAAPSQGPQEEAE